MDNVNGSFAVECFASVDMSGKTIVGPNLSATISCNDAILGGGNSG